MNVVNNHIYQTNELVLMLLSTSVIILTTVTTLLTLIYARSFGRELISCRQQPLTVYSFIKIKHVFYGAVNSLSSGSPGDER